MIQQNKNQKQDRVATAGERCQEKCETISERTALLYLWLKQSDSRKVLVRWQQQRNAQWSKHPAVEKQLPSVITDFVRQQLAAIPVLCEQDQGADTSNHYFVTIVDESYPVALRETDDAPLVLHIQTRVSFEMAVAILNRASIAFVGTRHPTSYGVYVTQKLISEVADITNQTIPIVSGFMYGVDQVAHKAALAVGTPTIAVLAHGMAMLPNGSRSLQQLMLRSDGLFISEYPPQQKAQKWQFIERNRIVAGLSDAVIITQAAAKSGTLHTAQFALDAGRAVGAVPGSILNQFSEGTRWLLNQGATLIAAGSDIMMLSSTLQADRDSEQDTENQVVKMLRNSDTVSASSQEIANALHCSIEKVLPIMTQLELTGLVTRDGGQWVLQYKK